MSVSKSRLLLSGLTAVSVLGVGVVGATSLNIGAEHDAAQFSFLDVKADDNFDRNNLEILKDWQKAVRERQNWQDGLLDMFIVPLDSNKVIEYKFSFQGAWPNMVSGWQ